ncbi:LysR family transcriptional regulator [Martelella alba]|nr:LysR family transcriptional regulator [Martelella alba]
MAGKEQIFLEDEFIRRGLRFSQLRLISILERSGQISAAAAQLGMTQSAASRLLGELEHTVGAKLYDRHGRGVVLTEIGYAIAQRAVVILHQLDESHREIAQMAAGARGSVRMGAVTGPSLEIVMPVIRELRRDYPEIELTVQVDTSDKLSEALFSYNLDFYLGRLPEDMDAKTVTMRPIGFEPVSLMARLDHPLASADTLSIGDCLDYDWVLQPAGSPLRRSIEVHLLAHGLMLPKHILVTTSALLTLAIISETDAISPVARPVAAFFQKDGILGGRVCQLPLKEEINVSPYSLIQRADGSPSPPVWRVLTLIEKQLANLFSTRQAAT